MSFLVVVNNILALDYTRSTCVHFINVPSSTPWFSAS